MTKINKHILLWQLSIAYNRPYIAVIALDMGASTAAYLDRNPNRKTSPQQEPISVILHPILLMWPYYIAEWAGVEKSSGKRKRRG